jgi:predicted metal-binding protein
MLNKKALEARFMKHNFTDFKWIDPKSIVISQWVRMKCLYGCEDYGKMSPCPPNVPTIDECRQFFQEYSEAVVFHFAVSFEDPEDRYPWLRKIYMKLSKLEQEVFFSGFQKAFLLFSCNICQECPSGRDACENPRLARPAPEALGIDVFSTVQNIGYPIQVLKDYSEEMNRYAFLLIE